MRCSVAVIVSVLLGLQGCLPVKTTLKESTSPPRREKRARPNSLEIVASASISGEELVLLLSQSETCDILEVRTVTTVRETAPRWPQSKVEFSLLGELFVTAGLVVLGGLILSDPEAACTSTADDGTVEKSNPDTCRAMGYVSLGAAAGLGTGYVIDRRKANVRRTVVDEVDDEEVLSTDVCREQAVSGADVKVVVGSVEFTARTSKFGEARFPMTAVGRDDLAELAESGTAMVRGKTVQFELLGPDYESLLAVLADDPNSKVHQEDEANRAVDAPRVLRKAYAALEAGRAAEVLAMVRSDQKVLEVVRDDIDCGDRLKALASNKSVSIAMGEASSVDVQQFCEARALYVVLFGGPSWRLQAHEFADLVSDLGDVSSSDAFERLSEVSCPGDLAEANVASATSEELPMRPSRSDVKTGIGGVSEQVAACGRSTTATGTVKVRLQILPNGTVGEAAASGGSEALRACVVSAVRRATFRPTQRGLSVTYPFALR